MVFDYKIVPIRSEAVDALAEIYDFPGRKKTVTKKLKRNRRKSAYDRRESIRDGVIVDLSFKNNRRKTRDRRHITGERIKFDSDVIVVL